MVDRYWLAWWNLAEPYTQRVFAHPVVNVAFQPESGAVHGVATGVQSRELAGDGWALGVMFRPAGFRPLADQPITTLRDRPVPPARAFGPAGAHLAAEVRGAPTPEARVAAVERFLAARGGGARSAIARLYRSSTARHSTWWVMGKWSKARSPVSA